MERHQTYLDFVIDNSRERLRELGVRPLAYSFDCEHVHGNNGIVLSRPSYCINLWAGEYNIAKVHYELDTRFGLEVQKEEIWKIQDAIADKLVSAITINGILSLYGAFMRSGKFGQFIIKESEFKSFLGLN